MGFLGLSPTRLVQEAEDRLAEERKWHERTKSERDSLRNELRVTKNTLEQTTNSLNGAQQRLDSFVTRDSKVNDVLRTVGQHFINLKSRIVNSRGSKAGPKQRAKMIADIDESLHSLEANLNQVKKLPDPAAADVGGNFRTSKV